MISTVHPTRLVPGSFTRSKWRGTTACDDSGSIGISFDLPDGSIVRLALDRKSAINLAGTVKEYIDAYKSERSHSFNSSGMPSVEGSTPFAGQNV